MGQWLSLLKAGLQFALLAERVFRSKNTALNFINRMRLALEETNGNTKEVERLLADMFGDNL